MFKIDWNVIKEEQHLFSNNEWKIARVYGEIFIIPLVLRIFRQTYTREIFHSFFSNNVISYTL